MRYILFLPLFLSTIAVSAQCFPESHNTSWNEAWYSCDIADNPNADRAPGHWIMYDFKHVYRLGTGRIWNINAPERLNDGFQNFRVDYSVDGEIWESLGVFTLDQAPGESTYEGQELINFAGDSARFIVLSATTNYGGECFGIAEARFEVLDVATTLTEQIDEGCFSANIFPNPNSGSFNFTLQTECNGPIEYRIYSPMSQVLKEGTLSSGGSNLQKSINAGNLAPGIYLLYLRQNGHTKQYPIVVQ